MFIGTGFRPLYLRHLREHSIWVPMNLQQTPPLYPGISTVAKGTWHILLLVKYPGVHLVEFPIQTFFSRRLSSFSISECFLFLLLLDEAPFLPLSSSESESILLALLPVGFFGLVPPLPALAVLLISLSGFEVWPLVTSYAALSLGSFVFEELVLLVLALFLESLVFSL